MFEKLYLTTRIVEDQDEAVAFYTENLGFEIKTDSTIERGRYVTVGPETDDNVVLFLQSLDHGITDATEQRKQVVGRNPGITYYVDDCRETYKELREREVEFSSEPKNVGFGIEAVATDPEGNEITLIEPRPMNES